VVNKFVASYKNLDFRNGVGVGLIARIGGDWRKAA
jgi:hypothetical protein